ncbi:hypothetical protein Tco_0946043 [Tanacetum coccineum]
MESIQSFLKKFDHIPPKEKPMVLLLAEEKFLKIKQVFKEGQNQPEVLQELMLKLLDNLKICDGILLKQEEQAVQKEQEKQAAQSFTSYWQIPSFDDEEYSIQVKEYLENSSKTNIPDLSLLDEHATIGERLNDRVEKKQEEKSIEELPIEEQAAVIKSLYQDHN